MRQAGTFICDRAGEAPRPALGPRPAGPTVAERQDHPLNPRPAGPTVAERQDHPLNPRAAGPTVAERQDHAVDPRPDPAQPAGPKVVERTSKKKEG
ncbi:hypothetical protein GGD88_003555 [Roseospira goensis]|uniref:Uncharacterized protein n=1 Tax=Roseospira goensis TaxID=391922 RepID=A0A7W6S2Q0_9PROT|nr:hypothetical protein [Roseospira goensis]